MKFLMQCVKLLFLPLLLLSSCSLQQSQADATQFYNGMVKKVYDGDTILVATIGKGNLKVRLYGIDAPETSKPDQAGQPYGSQSRRILQYKVMGKEVRLEVREIDQYKRSVAVVRIGDRDINAEMVAEGMTWAYRYYLEGDYASEYVRLEEQARKQRLGLWKQTNPQPPWDFRRQTK